MSRVTTSDGKLIELGDKAQAQLANSGEYGTDRINDTALHNGNYVEIVVIQDATFTTLTGNINLGTLPQTLTAGTTVVGRISAIQMSSGSILALKGE